MTRPTEYNSDVAVPTTAVYFVAGTSMPVTRIGCAMPLRRIIAAEMAETELHAVKTRMPAASMRSLI